MDILQPTIYGIVQGLGEFLPISSTAHLVLVPFLTGWKDPGLAFDVALHAGTLLAVLAYFWRDWLKIFQIAFWKNAKSEQYQKNILWLLVLATIPGVLAGYFLEDYASTVFRSPWVIVFTLAFFGFLLYILDKYAKQKKGMRSFELKDALIIGLAQAVAIIPGVSRSGATVTAGRALGFDRVNSAKFSFLLSTPIIFGATLNQLPDLMRGGMNSATAVGVAVSAVSGYLAIKYLIKFVQNYSYKIFFWYRLLLAATIAAVIFWR